MSSDQISFKSAELVHYFVLDVIQMLASSDKAQLAHFFKDI